MVLVLSVLRCPDQAVPEQRQVPGGEYTLGRGAECDWPLTDPDRVLSKRHCALEYLAGGWQLRDLSTNGTFVNGAADPVGRDQVRPLRDGDRLRLGAYEIECRVVEEAGFGEARWASASALPDPMAPPPPSDIFAAPLPGLGPAGGTPAGGAPLLPSDFDPFAPDAPSHSLPDHRPGTQDVFVPPRATLPDLLPEDWNTPPAPPRAPDPTDPFAHLPDPFADAPPPAAPPARPLPDPFAPTAPAFGAPLPGLTPAPPPPPLADPFAEAPPPAFTAPLPGLGPAPAPLPDPFAEAPPPAAAPPSDPFAEPPGFAPVAPPPPMAPSAPAPPPAASPLAMPGTDGSLQAALEILLRGAGLPPAAPGTDPAAALAQAGEALRAAVGGLRALLIARGDVKREFRIEQTMLRAAGNNPLKFAATDEAALQALLAPRGGGPAAVRETVEDLTAHQLATIAATQAAARALLARLAPAGLEAEQPTGGISLPGAREKRLWEAYRRLHQQVHDQFEDDFDSAFGKAFARAYEQATRGGR
ncbi:type VI secretion system-associated FHA domain protein TagH [Roseococcus suduntuyensis]|uniref:Type VI secretion system protein ImpI/type VI secretion system protein n=1 Tax=Roseococcus suduntuyensis TaxID=455361 RepID=A0A840A8Q4_9PROT|nr:type VI secretion system-associated FHA domain protein TagH [Roseococcus suduntuyensis]MBB3896893.1 type VI secretion system protein ImpI/type VI secretion system protein [Roseococcus suduntuyensis]